MPKHRNALVLSDHPLTLEPRRPDHCREFVATDEYLCRLCVVVIKTPEQGIILCNALSSVHAFVPRDDCLCRLCGVTVEAPEHAILLCKADDDLVNSHAAALSVK